MKSKYLVLSLALVLFSSNLFAQDFSFEISLENANFWSIKNLNPLNVKITNKSEQTLDTKDFLPVRFYFSKCSKSERCNVREDNFAASKSLEQKIIKKDESFEFQINLADLYWNDPVSNAWDFNHPKNIQTIPMFNKHFFAEVTLVYKYLKSANSKKSPLKKSYRSNEIIFNTKPEAE